MALKIRDLTVAYQSGGQTVRPFERFDLDIAAGELAVLLGPSGSGKTTLLSAIAGLLTPESGSLLVDGVGVASLSQADLVRHRRNRVGVVFQAFNLIPSLTAVENVMVPLLASGWHRRRAREQAQALLDRVGLHDRWSHRPGALSGGQQQRVAIARALAADPPVILADEPTAHLDHLKVDGVRDLLRGLADDGRVVLVATHDDRLLPVADRVVRFAA